MLSMHSSYCAYYYCAAALQFDHSPLHVACIKSHSKEIVRLLLADPRVDVELCDKVGISSVLCNLVLTLSVFYSLSFVSFFTML